MGSWRGTGFTALLWDVYYVHDSGMILDIHDLDHSTNVTFCIVTFTSRLGPRLILSSEDTEF